jgi:hypothetical protein
MLDRAEVPTPELGNATKVGNVFLFGQKTWPAWKFW